MCFSHQAQSKTFKIATIAPNGSFWMNMMKQGAKEIKKETGGRVKFKFYPGGVMGSQGIVLKKMKIGQLHGGALTSGSLGALYPDSQIYSLPLIFKTFKEIDFVRQKMDKQITEGLETAGIVTFGISEGGMAYTMSNKPVSRVSDLPKRKIWSPTDNKNVALTLEAIDVTPIPLSIGDVFAGLQTNLIDTVATSPAAAIALNWHTKINYITDVPLIYFYTVLALDKKAFNKISTEDQLIVRRVMTDTVNKIDKKSRKDNFAALDALQNQGIKLIKPNNEELRDWYKKGNKATDLIFSKGAITDKTKNELMMHISTFRTQQAAL